MAQRRPIMKQCCAMTVSLTPGPFSLREKLGVREEAPARGVLARIGGKAAQSGEKGGEVSLREFHINASRCSL